MDAQEAIDKILRLRDGQQLSILSELLRWLTMSDVEEFAEHIELETITEDDP